MTEIRRSYLVCATQRSGSTLLCELLNATGVAGHPQEYFEAVPETGAPPRPADFLEGLDRTGLGIRDDPEPPEAPPYSSLAGLADYRAHLERTFAAGTTPNDVFGAKLMFNQLDDLRALAVHLPEFSGLATEALLEQLFSRPRYVWVSREDTVRQAVSMWKALQTRRWRSGNGNDRSTEPQYHFEGIDHLVRRFAADEDGWSEFFAWHGIEPLRVRYEADLERDPEATVRRVLEWIDVSPPADWRPEPPTSKQADAASEDWVAAYHRDLSCRRTSSI